MMRRAFHVALLAKAVLLAGTAVFMAGAVVRPVPAVAQATNFRQEWEDIKGTIPYLSKERDPIDFAERAPLVVPPTNDLPPPADSASRIGVTDTDVVDRRKALSDPRRPVPANDPGATAAGASARAYLIEPPSGFRDPAAVQAGIVTDKPRAETAKPHRKHARRKAPDVAAAQ